jgi:hypothetical protein
MPKFLRKLFNKDILNNQRGSSLSITIVVIAVMAFSVTSITKLTVNLSSSTTAELESVNDESIGKGLITQAIADFETYITATDSYVDFNNTEIPRILNTYNVIVSDETDNFDDFGDNNGKLTKVYKFSFVLANGGTLYKYAYMSNSGSSYETFHPFDFSIGTEGDLILNGGFYDDVKMFGNSIYVGNQSPWQEDQLDYLGTTHHLTSGNNGTFPTFTDNGNQSEIFFTDEYQYCTSGCFSVVEDGSSPYTINKSNYVDVEGGSLSDTGDIQGDNITSFFNDFDFNDFAFDEIANHLPTDNRTITQTMTAANFETVIRNNMDEITYRRNGRTVRRYPSTAYVDISNDVNYTFNSDSTEVLRFAAVYDNAAAGTSQLTIWDGVRLQDWDDEGLIVLGDLEINNGDNFNETLRGTFVVTGDLTLTGRRLDFTRATFIVFGETIIDFDPGYGLYTTDNNYELSIVSKDNIRINSQWTNYGTTNPTTITALLYTDESIFVNAVSSKIVLEGAMFARALGNSSNPIFLEDDSTNQVNGIVINSFRGYVSRNYAFDWDIWNWTKSLNYVNSNSVTANRFQIESVPAEEFADTFLNLPAYGGVTVIDGEYTLETSEWKIE